MMDLTAWGIPERDPWYRRMAKKLYTRILLLERHDLVRHKLMTDPSLVNARFYAGLAPDALYQSLHTTRETVLMSGQKSVQYSVMAIHYNTMVDTRAALTSAQVQQLLEGDL